MGLKFEVLEEAGTPPTVLGDRARLRQLLSNLVGNALKHTSEGSICVHWGLTESGLEPNQDEIVVGDSTW